MARDPFGWPLALALGVAGALAFSFVAWNPSLRLLAEIWVAVFAVLAAFQVSKRLSRRDKYDLSRLREAHEQAELDAAQVPEVAFDADEAYCPRCGKLLTPAFQLARAAALLKVPAGDLA